MRKPVRVSGPIFVITMYYLVFFGLYWYLLTRVPGMDLYLPSGGLEELLRSGADRFELVQSLAVDPAGRPYVAQLAIGIVCAAILMAPVSWIYFLTTPDKRIDQSFAQTMLILPVIVAGIAMIVQHSLALAFSLAGIVAAVRFRFTLNDPSHTLYVFCAIAIGIGAGVSAAGVSAIISVGFVYGTLALWIMDYGARLNSPFFSFMTSRDHQDGDL
jgi:hypothetical protein